MIQKQIFFAAKTYNLDYMHKLQKYLLNSNEAKIISINQTLKEVYKYYNYYNKEKYITSDYKKFMILKFLFDIKFCKNQVNSIISEKIKQHLIYLCIKPEWQAKFIKGLPESLLVSGFNLFTKTNLDNLYQTKKHRSHKYFFAKNLISKLQFRHYFNQAIKNWLYNNYCANLHNLYNIKLKRYSKERIDILNYNHKALNNLFLLLLTIMTIDFKWYFFYVQHINSTMKCIKSCNYTCNQDKFVNFNSRVYLLNLIKLLLYNKNRFNQLKVSSINKNDVFIKSYRIFKEYYDNNFLCISTDVIQRTNKLFNVTIYYWLKKILKATFYIFKNKHIKKANFYLNQYVYNFNVDKCYKFILLTNDNFS